MQVIQQIIDIFQTFRMPAAPNDEFELTGKQALADKLFKFVANNEPLKFSMLGYPMKSPNTRDKVLGDMPDLGEQKSLENFRDFDNAIREVYAPGIDVAIISDGYIFSDIMGVSNTTVAQYEEIAKDMARVAPIRWYDMTDFYPNSLCIPDVREKVMEQYGINEEVLTKRILMDPDVNTLYRGMIMFMEQDLAMQSFPSRNQLQKRAKIVAREMMFRNEAYSALIRDNFSDHIRLSMHQSVNSGTKYSFQLIRSPLVHKSPWHSAILIHADGVMESIHRKDAPATAELVNVDGRPFYFQEV